MKGAVAHDLDGKQRTEDVRIKEVSPFSKMLLSDAVRKGLQQAGFVYPTVIQATAIPVGKSGLDLLVQSKSGTGKTLIFSTILLEAYRSEIREPQSLIVVPTREIAVQIEDVLNQIGRFCQGFRAVSVIGGLDVADDRKKLQNAKAIVGTPGRLLHLLQNEVLNTSRIKLLILDEADKMYTQSFRQDLQRIQKALPSKRQTIACSATFCDGLDSEIAKIMKNPLLISTEERATLLIGIKQFVYELPEQKTSILEMGAKLDALKEIFGRIAFKQCLIFAGSQSRADSYRNYLEKEGWPCELISGAQDQQTRLEMFRKFREFKTRILLATDLMSRGVDSENVNLVINLELPTDVVTYLHRIGRAGRFGSHGIAISFLASEKDRLLYRKLINQVGSGMGVLKFPLGESQLSNVRDFWDFSDFEAECKYYGCFGVTNLMAPLASADKDSLEDNSQENKENNSCQLNNAESNSSIDTKTFQVDSTGITLNMLDLLVDRPEYNAQVAQKLTPQSHHSSSQQLPSSNTIDDASSIAADSLRSSQQDVSRYQSILMERVAIPTLVEFLVDVDESDVNGEKKQKIDLFEDYNKAMQQQESESDSISTAPKTTPQAIGKNFKSLLIDQPRPNKSTTTNAQMKDIYSDYDNFDVDEASSSISQATAASESIDKATFILSVATPPQARESIEEFRQNSSIDLSQASTISETQSLSEVKHFPSPVHNQPLACAQSIPDVVPPPARCGLPMRSHKLTVNVGAQIEIPSYQSPNSLSPAVVSDVAAAAAALQPSPTPSIDGSNETLSSGGEHESVADSAGSSTERGGVGESSGFDEQPTSSSSSGIQTSEEEESEAHADDSDVDDGEVYETSSDENESISQYTNNYDTDDIEGGDNAGDADEETDEDNELQEQNINAAAAAATAASMAAINAAADMAEDTATEISEAEEAREEAACSSQKHKFKKRQHKAKQHNAEYDEIAYEEAYARWVQMYWKQLNFLNDYVKAASAARQQQD